MTVPVVIVFPEMVVVPPATLIPVTEPSLTEEVPPLMVLFEIVEVPPAM